MAGVGRTVHVADVVVPVVGEPVRGGAVLVDGGCIVAVGRREDVDPGDAGVIEHRGVMTPGLVNAHAHLQYTDFADLAVAGLGFFEWIRTLTRRRSTFSDGDWLVSTRRGVAGLLATGTTAVADVVTDPVALGPPADANLAGVSFLEAVGADDAGWLAQRERLLGALSDAPSGRAVGVSPHTLYTLGTAVFRDCLAIARARNLRLHTHLAETSEEVEYVLAATGPFADWARTAAFAFELLEAPAGTSPARHLDALGGLAADCSVAHGVHLDADDRALLRERGTVVALCPRSNALLGAGDAPVAAHLAEGSAIAVGTDSLASSPSLDLLADVRALRDLARRQGYAGNDLERRLIEAATVGGARSMGLDDIGVLTPGARADLAVFAVPTDTDPYDALVAHGAGTCVATVLSGEVVHPRRVVA
jgi:cytosine/adenosine deaminase-related metal-dependent hydrolase